MKPFFSIIIASYNVANTIQRCLNSIKEQTFQNKELIIIDGSSVDGTIDLIKANNYLIDYWVSERDTGISNAWNKALDVANGTWLYFLGADDYLYDKNVLERVYHVINKIKPRYRLLYGKVCMVSRKGKILFIKGTEWQNNLKFSHTLGIPHQGVFQHHSLFEENGYFDENFTIAGDYDFLLRSLKTSQPYFMKEINVAAMEYYGISSQPNNNLFRLRESAKVRRKNGYFPYPVTWIIEYLRALCINILLTILGKDNVKKIAKAYCKLMKLPSYWEKY